jgi:hypothetical protein
VAFGLVVTATLGFLPDLFPTSAHAADTPDRAMAVVADHVTLAALMARGQPERWKSAERTAVEEKEQGDANHDPRAFKSAREKAIYNQKNGWSDDGSERIEKGAPLRNNAKRGGDQKQSGSNNQEPDNGAFLDSFVSMSVTCGDKDGDSIGEGDYDEWEEFWDLGIFFGGSNSSASGVRIAVTLD